MSEKEKIAKTKLYAIDKDGRGFEINLSIGVPYPMPNDKDWACSVGMEGLHSGLHEIYGVDSWQALNLALKLPRRILTYFVEDGGKLFLEKGGDEINIDEIF